MAHYTQSLIWLDEASTRVDNLQLPEELIQTLHDGGSKRDYYEVLHDRALYQNQYTWGIKHNFSKLRQAFEANMEDEINQLL